MLQTILQFLDGLPHALTIIILAATPIFESRVSVPLAIALYDFPAWQAIFLTVVGSSIPAISLPIILERLENPCRKAWSWCDRMFDWVRGHVQRRYTQRYQVLGTIGLILFVAIPLPMTGIWTGALAAWVFRLRKRTAIPALLVGATISSMVVAAATLGVFGAIRFAI